MASKNSKDIQRVELEIPFHQKCSEFINYEKNIQKIQDETQTRIKLLLIIRIEGHERKVEEAWRHVSQLEFSELDGGGKEENLKEMKQLLNDIQKKIAEAQGEKAQIEETIISLKTELQEEIHGLKKEFEKNQKKLQEEIHVMSIRFEENSKKGSEEDDSTDEYVNLDEFYASEEYIQKIYGGNQPSHIACLLGRLDVVKKLIEDGADINEKDDYGHTALHCSALKGHLNVVKYLIKKNALINQQDSYGNTALICAVSNGHAEVVTYLCSNKANIHIQNKKNETAFDVARQRGRTEMLKILDKYL